MGVEEDLVKGPRTILFVEPLVVEPLDITE